MRFSSASPFTRARLTRCLPFAGGSWSAPPYPSTSNFTSRSMSLAENDAWKNSTPNCFTRCAGTVIIGRVRLRGDGFGEQGNGATVYDAQTLVNMHVLGAVGVWYHPPGVGARSDVIHKMWAGWGYGKPCG